MDDRKRSLAPDADDGAHKAKRRKDENGNLMKMDDINEKNIESFQKDAILRQMNEYKKQKKVLEKSYEELLVKQRDHDDHLRTVDAWFSQLLDEVRLIAADTLPPVTSESGGEMFRTALEFKDHEVFSTHLRARSDNVKLAIAEIFSRIPTASPEVCDLQSQLASILASEKSAIAAYQQANTEMAGLNQRLETASMRYIKAEKQVERAKSVQVQKLERQAMTGGTAEASVSAKSETPKREHSETNGELENGVASEEAEAARKEATALAELRKKQLEEMETENERLTTALSAARTKISTLSDDDYAETALFKTFKSQHEEVIKRVNDLEATNVQLREEAQKLQAERTSYRMQIDEEDRNNTIETESQIARCEVDLARIRHSRDELTSELAIRKSGEEDRRASLEQARELAVAHEHRIQSLESEVERLKLQLQDAPTMNGEAEDLDNDALKSKLHSLQSAYDMLNKEIPSLEEAYKKTNNLASKKYTELLNSEELVARLNAEKVKAEQKYFGAMKAKEAREQELRILKSQNTRSGEIISSLKDTDGKSRELVAGLERQVAEAKEGTTKLETQYRAVEQRAKDATTLKEGLAKQVDDLKKLVESKDADSLTAAKARRSAEEALEIATTQLESSKAEFDAFRKSSLKSSASGGEGDDIWRAVAICPICNKNLRNTALKTCGHVLCDGCVAGLVSNRNRKCPSCGKAFGSNDSMRIVLA
ncbi:hypothetical protein B0A48_10321 [Cryoendolithus antarcticus]|uniref:E3 ubiquitin protein ligase n=1 Tax=Cryoendolithus antarcticus TaxID=1507870 RepID=A0A1V8SWW8_9PEZI|nr:hypothetical protein B0A48_10321 [Cryoendolithus antarcticus]